MGTYADRWNQQIQQQGISLPTQPQLVVLSGEWDMHAETSELMDYEVDISERAAEALGDLRGSSMYREEQQDPRTVEMMEVDYGPRTRTFLNVVPDTNVMISHLDVLDGLTRLLSSCPDLSISILLPGIVMSELDGLRKASGRSCQEEAQRANRWAANELAKRAVVRGQRDFATQAPGGSWRRYYHQTGKENPDSFIMDCVFYEQTQASGRWVILTLDQNCAAQCLANGFPVIRPSKQWSVEALLQESVIDTPIQIHPHHLNVLSEIDQPPPAKRAAPRGPQHRQPATDTSTEIDWANAPESKSRRKPARLSPKAVDDTPPPVPRPLVAREMEVDDSDDPAHASLLSPPLPPAPDPRDDLQEQLVTLLTSVMPSIMQKTIEAHNTPSNESIHAAPKQSRPKAPPLRRLPSTKSNAWKSWPVDECIMFLADYPPPAPPNLETTSDPAPKKTQSNISSSNGVPDPLPEKTKIALHSLAALVRKNRRGRDFGRGDWDRASIGVAVVWPPVAESFARAVKDVFES